MRIGEAAELLGVPASTIRYYEKEGLLKPARISGRRELGANDLTRLRFVKLAQAAGFSVVEMKSMIDGFDGSTNPGAEWRAVASDKRVVIAEQIGELERMMEVLDNLIECRCNSLEECVERSCR